MVWQQSLDMGSKLRYIDLTQQTEKTGTAMAGRGLNAVSFLCFGGVMAMSLGERIRKERMARGFTQEVLAGLLRVHRTSVGNWESGRTSPKGLHLWMLEKVLRCKLDGDEHE